MSIQSEINDYLSECGVFYFATVDGDKPVVRPLGFKMMVDDVMYFGVATHKDVYKQLTANPNVYICACKPDAATNPNGSGWIRVSAKAVRDDDPALVEACWQTMPELKGLYENLGWTMGIFHLEEGTAIWVDGMMSPSRTEGF